MLLGRGTGAAFGRLGLYDSVGLGPLLERAGWPAGDFRDVRPGALLIQRARDVEVEERVHVRRGHAGAHFGPGLVVGLGLEPPIAASTSPRTNARSAGRPELLADQLSLIMEGTYAWAQALSAAGPARHARTLAESLLDVS